MPNKLQKMFFMLWKLKKDLVRDRQIYQLTDDLHSSQLGEYYFLMTEEQMLAGHSQQFHFDEKGIPIIPSYIDVEDKKMVYYPISIGQYGLAIWHTYLQTRSEQDKKRSLQLPTGFIKTGSKIRVWVITGLLMLISRPTGSKSPGSQPFPRPGRSTSCCGPFN